jgi:hypothetical protein
LSGAAFGLCNAFCNAQDCPEHPEKDSCEELRRNFERQTGSSTFPCETTTPATPTVSAQDCPDLAGAPFGLCLAFCALDCDQQLRFPCRLIRGLFRGLTGDTEGLVCASSAMSAADDACSGLTGRAAKLCHKFCDHTAKLRTTAARLRLQRQFVKLTGGRELTCSTP